MKLFVTGGAGFIGSHFIKYVLEKYPDDSIINFDKLTYAGNLANLKEIENDSRYTFLKGDICDKEAVVKAISDDVDVIVNFAAESHVDRSILEPQAFLKTDVLGTQNLLEVAKEQNIKRYLQVSTDEVYGSLEKGLFKEADNLQPNSPYSASKAGGDLIVRAYHETFDLPTLITRGSNTYGPNQYPEKLIPLFVTNLLEEKKVPLYGDGMNVRDWIYVRDHCSGIDTALRKGEIGEIYNVGGSNELTNKKITHLILESLNKREEMIDYVEDRLGHDRRYALNTDKLRGLGWSPQYSFKEALKKTIAWYQSNQDWWQQIKSGEYMEYYKKQYAQKEN